MVSLILPPFPSVGYPSEVCVTRRCSEAADFTSPSVDWEQQLPGLQVTLSQQEV